MCWLGVFRLIVAVGHFITMFVWIMNSCCCRTLRRHQLKGIEEKTAVVISTFSNDYFSLAVSVALRTVFPVVFQDRQISILYNCTLYSTSNYSTIAFYLEDILTFEFLSFISTCTKQSIPCFSFIQLYDSSIVGKVVSP